MTRIKDIFSIVSGATPSSKTLSYFDGNITWITPADMDDFGKIAHSSICITPSGYNSCGTKMCPAGSIILSKRAPIGKVNIAETNFCTNQGCLTLVPLNKNVHTPYYAYFFLDKRKEFESLGQGTTFNEIPLKAISNYSIVFPPLSEQRSIADYLDKKCADIDKAVSIQQRRIELLKKLKQSTISQAVTRGLNPNVKMKDSGVKWIGEIPEHWEVKRVKSFAKTLKGRQTEYFEEQVDNSARLLSVECLRLESTSFNTFAMAIDKEQLCTSKDIVIIWDGAGVGEFLKAKEGVLSSTIAKIIINEKKVLADYFWQWRYKIEYTMKYLPTGMGIPHLNPTLFYNYMIPIPPLSEQRSIADYLDNRCAKIDKMIANIEAQVKTYGRLKQSLISEVVTGKRKI